MAIGSCCMDPWVPCYCVPSGVAAVARSHSVAANCYGSIVRDPFDVMDDAFGRSRSDLIVGVVIYMNSVCIVGAAASARYDSNASCFAVPASTVIAIAGG